MNIIYFICTPLMGAVYFLYVFASLYENHSYAKRALIFTMLPSTLYFIMVLINLWTHWIYQIDAVQGYVQGPYIDATYIIFYLYCILCVLLVLIKGINVDRSIRSILFTFPIIAAVVILIQEIYPNIVLTGSAATTALLILYLNMQNKQISIDYLTSLANRQEFLNMLKMRTHKSREPFTIVIVSLRNFKRTNNTYGQHAGDLFLLKVKDYLKNEFHLNEQQLYRYSGDEFAIWCKDDVHDIVERMKARMAKPWNVEGYSSMLHAVIGVVEYPSCADTLEQVINGIEFSIKLAKKHKGNCVYYCTKDVLDNIRRRQKIIEILQDKLHHHSFDVYYQPIYDVQQQRFVAAEALLRILDSPLGPLYPDEFIPLAEESGLIIDITYCVLDEVCHMIQKMKKQNISFEKINVNFPTAQFTQPDLIEKVYAILEEHDVLGEKLKIEITESTLSNNHHMMMKQLQKMRSFGMTIGLDDFGTGYSNAARVIAFPINTIKMDKSLVWSAMDSKRSALFIKEMIQIFCKLGYDVLAEGVETKAQNDFMRECGCTLIQGYYYAKPMDKEHFLAFMEAHDTKQE